MFAYKAPATCSPVMFYAQLKFLVFMNIVLWNLKEEEKGAGAKDNSSAVGASALLSSPEVSAGLGDHLRDGF